MIIFNILIEQLKLILILRCLISIIKCCTDYIENSQIEIKIYLELKFYN